MILVKNQPRSYDSNIIGQLCCLILRRSIRFLMKLPMKNERKVRMVGVELFTCHSRAFGNCLSRCLFCCSDGPRYPDSRLPVFDRKNWAIVRRTAGRFDAAFVRFDGCCSSHRSLSFLNDFN